MGSAIPEVTLVAAGFSLGVISTVGFWKMPSIIQFMKLYSGVLRHQKNPKLVIITRSNLAMGKGKIASQCAHAAVCCYKEALKVNTDTVKTWELLGQPKVVVRINDSDENVLQLVDKAKKLKLVTCVIRDAGKTQVLPGSFTVVGIGPGDSDVIDIVTGHLKLL